MGNKTSYPTANGKRFTLDVDPHADVPAYSDYQHTDRLDNFTVMEVVGKSCHGMQLEGLAYPITPIGMHYLLIHYDILKLDEETYRVEVGGLVKKKLSLQRAYGYSSSDRASFHRTQPSSARLTLPRRSSLPAARPGS